MVHKSISARFFNLCFTSDGKGPHHAKGKELLEAMGCLDLDSIPTHETLVEADPSASHELIRALCARGSGGVDQSNSYEAQARLIALESSRKLQLRVVGLSSLSEHACTGPFFFKDSDDTDAVAATLHRSMVVLDRDGFNSKKKHPWYSKARQLKLCLRGVTLDELLEHRNLVSEVSVTLPGSSEALRGAQLRRPDIEREHLVCYFVQVRAVFGLTSQHLFTRYSLKQNWENKTPASFLEQFAWPPYSSPMATLTSSHGSNTNMSKQLLQAAALAGRGFN